MEPPGIALDYNDKEVTWEGPSIPLKHQGTLADADVLNLIYAMQVKPPSIKEAEECQSRILDADYSAVDIKEYVTKNI